MLTQRITTTYHPIKFRREIKLECKSCGKKLKRVVSDYYTTNPFNKNTPKENQAQCIANMDNEEKRMRENGINCRACDIEGEKA